MKTYPNYNDEGILTGFDINKSGVSARELSNMLLAQEVVYIEKIKRFGWFDDEVLEFFCDGERFFIVEPFGDNSQYWVFPENKDIWGSERLELLIKVFDEYNTIGTKVGDWLEFIFDMLWFIPEKVCLWIRK